MHVANVLLILNLDHIELSHEIAVLQVLALGQLFKALEISVLSQFPLYQSVRFSYIIKCSVNIVHHHDHHHLLDDVLCPLRAANAGLYHLVQLGGHEDRLDNAGDGHAKGGPALAKLAAEDALAGRRVFPLTTKFIGVINRHAEG